MTDPDDDYEDPLGYAIALMFAACIAIMLIRGGACDGCAPKPELPTDAEPFSRSHLPSLR